MPVLTGLALLVIVLAGASVESTQSAPAIGAPPETFVGALGTPNDHSAPGELHFLRCPRSNVDQFIIDAPDAHVWTISYNHCGGPSQSNVPTDPAAYLPADSILVGTVATATLYVSSTLGAALPANMFEDCDGNAVALGTLLVEASADGGWVMSPGACP